jgi:hypothetical protein
LATYLHLPKLYFISHSFSLCGWPTAINTVTVCPCVPKYAKLVITDFGYERAANRDVCSKSVASHGLLGVLKNSADRRKELKIFYVIGPTN